MKLSLTRSVSISVREQLATQIFLAIAGGDLLEGERLPSTRGLAKRLRVHPNTISAVYRLLQRDGWVEFRRGGGVYVHYQKSDEIEQEPRTADQLIAKFFHMVWKLDLSLPEVYTSLRKWLKSRSADHFVLIEPNKELRQIVISEIKQAVSWPVVGCDSCENRALFSSLGRAVCLLLPSKEASVHSMSLVNAGVLTLRIRSVSRSLAQWSSAPPGVLIGIASSWPGFIRIAHTSLVAAGFEQDCLVSCDARRPNWLKRLAQVDATVCDSLTATKLPTGGRVIPFRLLADTSIEALRRCQKFFAG